MKYILLLFLLTSCTAYQHLKKAEKHTQKAIAKGATIKKDTTYVNKDRNRMYFISKEYV